MTDENSTDLEPTARPARAAAFVTVWVFGFVILRIFAVSGYNWDTAFAVSTTLSLNDGVSLLFGSLMAGHTFTAGLLILLLPLLVAASLWGPRAHRPVMMLLAALGLVVAAALTLSFRNWWMAPAAALVFVALALTRLLPTRNRISHGARVAVGSIGWLAPVSLLLVAALVTTPWVPRERIVTTDGTITGYVLSVDSGYLNVLTDHQQFRILLSSDIISRS